MAQAPRGGPPRLELLVRKKNQVIIQEIESSKVFLRMCPQRVVGLDLEINSLESVDGVRYVLHNRNGSQYLQLSEQERFLWALMDGSTSMGVIATALFLRFGTLDQTRLQQFLQTARKAGLIELAPQGFLQSRLPPQTWLRRWLEADWQIKSMTPWFSRIWRWVFPLRLGLPLMVLSACWGVAKFSMPVLPLLDWLIWLPLVAGPAIFLHEVAHGLACVGFGRRVRAVGISFEYFFPTPYVDTTDMFLGTPRQHAQVALAGPLASFLMGGLAALACQWAPSPALYVLAASALATALVTFWPFLPIESDGYQAFSDILEVPMLRRRAHAWLRGKEEVTPALRWRFLVFLFGQFLTVVVLALWVTRMLW